MEVATTSNHHHHNHHHHHHHLGHQLHHPTATKHRLPMAKQEQQQTQNKLSLTVNNTPAVDASASNTSPRSPFQREVREWQRVDPDTGALLSGRLEADRWINGPLNKYGKISDSQNISQSNGTQHTQRKQLEVLQRRTANGAVQVIRAQTVQTSSSRSWSSSNSNSASTSASASASASPICVANSAAGVGGTSSSGGGGRSIVHNHNNNHTHFHSTLEQHLAEANTHWLQLSPPTIAAANVDISEVSTDDDHDKAAAAELVTALATEPTPYIVDDVDDTDDDHNERHDDVSMNCDYSISRNSSGVDGEGGVGGGMDGGGGGKGQIMNGDSEFTVATVNSQCSARLVPDTAPSLKLSNLMKSNSGGSNNTDSSGNNSTTTTNTHTYIQSAATGKVSLHSIVGGGGGGGGGDETTKCAPTTAITNGTTVPGTKTWQQQKQQERQQHNAQHLEQATLYGQNINSSRARVGVLADCCDVGDHNDDGVSCVAPKTKLADADETQSHYKHNHNNEQTKNDLSGALTPTRRRDLESFRQYASSKAKAALEADIAEREMQTLTDDKHASKHDDDLRLSTRQLRRQQQPFSLSSSSSSASTLQRSHSISTDDLSNDWENEEGVAESNEWRRVSKLRRSFQSSSSANNNNSNEQLTEPSLTATRRRPFDLPASSVSVSRIRAELESGRRLTTAMRNNRVDLAALDSILHGPKEEVEKTRGNSQKTNALLTAESLKEIRGRLKKLSDESLYKDDFIAHQQPPSADEHIEVQQSVRRKLTSPRLQQLTPDQSLEITQKQQTNYAAERAQRNFPERDPLTTRVGAVASTRHSPSPKQHTSRSLETRQKVKDTNSLEWHSRRKSYGFEKVSPPDAKSMSRMDASTDSGLGRSSELNNWSPTEPTPTTRATVIHFGEPTKTAMNSQTPYRTRIKSPARHTPTEDEDLHKRYSIAVDESQYVRDNLRKTSQVHLNGFQEPNLQLSRFESTADGIQSLSASNSSSTLFQRSQNAQKRVEFCKTEVHFAAESGRVNIVETDGKPPPTNNFRRRRRTTSGALQILTRTAASAAVASLSAEAAASTAAISNNVTLFGDSDDLYQQRHRTIASSLVAYRATLVDPQDNNSGSNASALSTSVTVSVQKTSDSHGEVKRGSYASTTSGIDTTDNENDEISAIRGILKNKPVKPKPYHLGENIESADALWGVQLKPVAGGNGSTALSNREKDDSPTAALNKSVAERVRIVEKRREHTGQNGYSTKINLSLDEPTPAIRDWPNADLPKSNVMSIELHSPQISLEKRDSFKRNSHTAPVARPRTISSALNSTEQQQPLHSGERYNNSTAEQREALKIVKEARGARKLRDHELSYFGVPNSQNQDEIYESKANRLPNVTSTNTISANKRTLPNHQHHQRSTIIGNENTTNLKMLTRRHDDNATNTEEATNTNETTTATKWQLLNDKPDLLRHSPMAVEPQLIRRTAEVQPVRKRSKSAERGKHLSPLRLTNERHNFNDDGADQSDHFYENIANEKITPVFKVKSPQPYDRKTDVERDAYLLSEMNENADITMKALSDEVAHKDRRRRRRSSLHRRESTPLETIDEKMVTRKPSDKCIAVKMSRGTLASEAKRHTRPATSSPQMYDTPTRVRTSSQSSVESSPRARSRSLSSEREYGNIRSPKSTRATSTSATKTQHTRIGSSSAGGASCGKQQHRSSSRDSQRSARLQYSSGDEVSANEQQRVRLKSKRSTNPTTASASSRSVERRSKKESISERAHQHETQKHHTTASRDEDRRHAASSTTHASQREERAECTARSQQQQRATSSGQSSKCREEPSGNTGSGSSGRHAISRANTAKSRSGIGSGIRLFRSLRGRADDTHTCAVHHSAEARMSSEHRSTSGRDKIGGGEHEHGKVEGVRERESLREREHEREIERAHEKENGRESKSQARGHSTTTASKTQHHQQHSNNEHHRLGNTMGAHQLSAREHKTSSICAVHNQHEPAATTTTHSKSTQNMNGRHTGGHHDGRRHKHNEQSHATKEHRKRSTRSGK
ncbi:pneumococcal serine-rich repeat protein isoform X5 [Eurosta solidaginis]|uniref:pneumococcal serine-rich repeat protein isoform X5 n=1 Tax=Eurosta solidaginis TaxID=178769 RepID=UPI00353085CC